MSLKRFKSCTNLLLHCFGSMLDWTSSLFLNPYFGTGFGLVWFGALFSIIQIILNHIYLLFKKRCVMTLEIHSNDQCYEWFLNWLTSTNMEAKNLSVKTIFNQYNNGKMLSEFSLIPGLGTHYFKYRSYWIQMNRNRPSNSNDYYTGSSSEFLVLTTFGRDSTLFISILKDARNHAMNDLQEKVVLYKATGTIWQAFGSPHKKRSMDSVILDEGIAEKLLTDVTEFIQSSQWYYERGIPYRRGYLLYGSPGSGKSSFIKALAGVLNYGICVMNLGEKELSDSSLSELLSVAPERSIIVLEDIDAAFSSRTCANNSSEKKSDKTSQITFSGLLNSLDGIIASEARILFMTTNFIDRLDPALIRPGRIDVKQHIGHVTDHQLIRMFQKFYPQAPPRLSQEFKQAFRDAVGDKNLSPAHVQGYFMLHKNDPINAISDIKNGLLDHRDGNKCRLSEDKIKMA